MVRAWIADVTPLSDKACYEYYYGLLPQFRKDKADALKQQSAKQQSVAAWTLWEKIRAEYGLPESSVFNLSHSGTWVMCAASDQGADIRLGCDIERIADVREGVARRFFCREEYGQIFGLASEEEQKDAFFRFWVLKESFLKATREGMALPMDSFCIHLSDPPELIRQPEKYAEAYFYREYEVKGIPYKMAVCSTDREIDEKIHLELQMY